ncbi:MAG: phospholipase D-like domain-containing protein [Saprospiraceae bacterium]
MSIRKKRKVDQTNADVNSVVQIVHCGKPYFDLLTKMIDEAVDTIHIQIYIYDDTATGLLVSEHLIKAASRGVKIFLLVDEYASKGLSKETVQKFLDSGIHFRYFKTFVKNKYFYFGRRLHHKIIVMDATKALIGGLNISDRYNDTPAGPAWLDFAIYLEGVTAKNLCILCWKTWKGYPQSMGITPCEKIIIPAIPAAQGLPKVTMLRNDWVRRKVEISRAYHRLIRNAKTEITILSSYFLPGKPLRRLMAEATRRGIRIRVISAGHSDVMIAKEAERWLYDWLLRNKIELYEYQPRVLHGKLGISDREWFTLGSYNINDLSAYASIELNLEVIHPEITKQLYEEMNTLISRDCIRITKEVRANSKNIFIQFRQWLAYEFLRIIFYLFTFYFKQRK